MKKTLRMGLIALALLAPAGMVGGCALFQDVAVAATSAPPGQSNVVAAAEAGYIVVANGAADYVEVAKPNQNVKAVIGGFNEALHDLVVAARAADKNGDSATVAALIVTIKQTTGEFAAYVAKLKGTGS